MALRSNIFTTNPVVACYQKGLSGRTSVGACGRYTPHAGQQQFRLATMVWRDGIFAQPGVGGKTHFQLDLPESYSVETRDASWTGRAIQYFYPPDAVAVDFRSTLPGPRFSTVGKSIFLRWGQNVPDGLRAIDGGGTQWSLVDHPGLENHLFLVAECRVMPVLIVLSGPLEHIAVTSHAHWEFRFQTPGQSMFLVPIADAGQLPTDGDRQAVWSSLLSHPPRECEETFRIDGDHLTIEAKFAGAKYAPLPPIVAQAGGMRELIRFPDDRIDLLDSLVGPYDLVRGDTWRATINLAWARAVATAQYPASGPLAETPEELAYAGDWTWEPGSAMDQLLALRTWAPLLKSLPADRRAELVKQLTPPTPADFTESLHTITEPVSGIAWAKEKNLFVDKGDISWDPDWYNGLTLSGLYRAIHCGVDDIATPARQLARDCREQRDLMLRYYSLFHDWGLWSAWTDARGMFWNPDCGHNGMEGLLAEAKLRREMGENESADFCLYLVGKTAVALMAMFTLPAWAARMKYRLGAEGIDGFRPGESGEETFGIDVLFDHDGLATTTAATKNPYCLAGHFPEYSALLKRHAPVDRLKRLAALWEEKYPQRYRDWIAFYIGSDPAAIRARWEKLDQEARIQAAVFYHLAPEVCLRLWVLDEPAEQIEQRFATPLNLAEQVLLRSGSALEIRS
jgi:hypothetical protein